MENTARTVILIIYIIIIFSVYELCLLLIIINPVLHFVGGCCDRQSKILTLLVLFWQQKRQDLRGIFNYHNVHIWEDENFRTTSVVNKCCLLVIFKKRFVGIIFYMVGRHLVLAVGCGNFQNVRSDEVGLSTDLPNLPILIH